MRRDPRGKLSSRSGQDSRTLWRRAHPCQYWCVRTRGSKHDCCIGSIKCPFVWLTPKECSAVGVGGPHGDVTHVDLEAWDRDFRLNVGAHINLSSLSLSVRPFNDLTLCCRWDAVMWAQVTSMVMMARHAIPEMRKTGSGGRIVNMSSVSGLLGGNPGVLVSPLWILTANMLQAYDADTMAAVSYNQRSHYPAHQSHGSTPWSGKHPSQLCESPAVHT